MIHYFKIIDLKIVFLQKKAMKQKYLIFSILIMTVQLCVNSQNIEYNPLLASWKTPYQTPPFNEIKPKHYLPAFISAITEAKMEIDAISLSNEAATFENTIVALDRAGASLTRISGIFFNLLEADASKELQALAKEITPLITDYQNYITLNEALFLRIKSVYDYKAQLTLTTEQEMLLKNTYLNFSRSGANLSPTEKKQYEKLTQDLSKLSLDFKENVLQATNGYFLHLTQISDVSGIPMQELAIAANKAKQKGLDGWVFDLSAPSYLAFMKYADNRELRKKIYIAYNSRGFKTEKADNSTIVIQLANKRLELAKLLGYETYADYVLETRMAEYKDSVWSFLNRLTAKAKPSAQKEITELQKFSTLKNDLQRWDWTYYADKLKVKKYNINDQEIKPYFELENVKKGIFELCHRLYDLRFESAPEIPVYHNDVQAYKVYDASNQCIAILYLDFYTRETKRNGAWMTSFRKQSVNGKGEKIIPFVSVVLNYTPASPDQPTTLTYDEFKTFLHEFGHALHGILSNVHYQSISGTSVPRDFVELPSQIMENWACEEEFLKIVALHYQTGKVIPKKLIRQLVESSKFHAGYTFLRQLNFGTLDMAWHSIEQPVNENVELLERRVTQQTEILPMVDACNISTAFSHIFAGGYAAGYYGYKWAEVLDADAFALFKQNGIFNQQTALLFKEYILSKGGSEKPMDLYIKFRGQKPSEDALLKRSGLIN